MHVFRLIRFLALVTIAPLLVAQRPQIHSQAVGTNPKVVFSAGTNAYNLSVTPEAIGPAQVGVGLPEGLLVTVTPIDGYNQPVKLACANLPPETSCSFDVETIPAGGGTTTMLFNTSAPRDCGTNTPYFYGDSASLRYIGPALAGLLLLGLPRWRMRLPGLLGFLALFAMLGLQGCGRCTDLGTRPGTYTFILNGTGENTVALALGDLVTVPITVTVNE